MEIKYININDLAEAVNTKAEKEEILRAFKGIKEIYYKDKDIKIIILTPEEYNNNFYKVEEV